jgi:hypothetical protein
MQYHVVFTPEAQEQLAAVTQGTCCSGEEMEKSQRTRSKTVKPISGADARVLDALKKSAKEAKRLALRDKVPFISSRRKTWAVPK